MQAIVRALRRSNTTQVGRRIRCREAYFSGEDAPRRRIFVALSSNGCPLPGLRTNSPSTRHDVCVCGLAEMSSHPGKPLQYDTVHLKQLVHGITCPPNPFQSYEYSSPRHFASLLAVGFSFKYRMYQSRKQSHRQRFCDARHICDQAIYSK